jgi:hypothetical protein
MRENVLEETSMRPLSKTAIEVLHMVPDHMEGWGDLWSHYDAGNPSKGVALRFRNFDRVVKALVRRGLVDEDDYGIELTDAGAIALKRNP